jgi:hypothetical protein
MKKILTEALAVANATSRSLFMNPRDPSWFYYPGSAWMNFLFVTGYEFETPIPLVTREGVKPFPPTGYRQLDARTAFFYYVTVGIQHVDEILRADTGHAHGHGRRDAYKKLKCRAATIRSWGTCGLPLWVRRVERHPSYWSET